MQPRMEFKNWTILLQQFVVGFCMARFKAGAHRVSAVSLAELSALQSFICASLVEHTKTGAMLGSFKDYGMLLRETVYAKLGQMSSQSF